ncbi:MAG TPA: response regulator transcription factor [Syntrophomonadaceae bacterium]|nr:response regulator transcription factor [Syntrophomonadaceae bacterium]
MRTIFVVDNEENLRFTIGEYLIREGFKVEAFASLEEFMLRLQSGLPDMFILNLLPTSECLEFCQEVKIHTGVPAIFIFPRKETIGDLSDLKLDDKDYMFKPFNPRELVARVVTVFRRSPLPVLPEDQLVIGNIRINPNDRYTMIDNSEVLLTTKEYELLLLMARQPQRSFNRQELLDRIWGYGYSGNERAVDDLVKRLRKKLRDNNATKNILTLWGYGYRFEA